MRLIAELEFTKVEVAIEENGLQLKPSEVAADVVLAAQRLRLGPGLMPVAFALEVTAETPAEFERQFQAVCRLARLTSVPLITVRAASVDTEFEAEVKRLSRMAQLAAAEGIIVSVATYIGTLAEIPDQAVQLCRQVPGLGLTLDPSHYLAGPHQGQSFDQVYPHVRHVHLRDTGKGNGHFQVRIGQGEVEYGRIISQLARHHYDRLLTVAIHDTPDSPFAMQPEVRKLKFLLESLV
jgi:sugar phosphate isomerase/epimerase